jgi:hypothetical protein
MAARLSALRAGRILPPGFFFKIPGTLYPQRLALTSPTSGGRSVGIVRLQTTATEFSSFYVLHYVRTN